MEIWNPRSFPTAQTLPEAPPPHLSPKPPAPPPPSSSRWATALVAARDLALAACRSSRGFSAGCGAEIGADLRRSATAVALELERSATSPERLMAALRALWRTGDLVDKAERLGLLDLESAVELLALGSRVEIPLVRCIRENAETAA